MYEEIFYMDSLIFTKLLELREKTQLEWYKSKNYPRKKKKHVRKKLRIDWIISRIY